MSGNGNGSYTKLEDEAEPVYSSAGLTSAEAAEAQKKWGKNEIPEEKEPVRSPGARAARKRPLAHHRPIRSNPPSFRSRWLSLLCGSLSVCARVTALEDVRHAVRWHDAGDDIRYCRPSL